MSQPTSAETETDKPQPEAVQKQNTNIYTVMLILSFVAISLASLLLYLEANQWGSFPWWKPASSTATSYLHEPAESHLPLANFPRDTHVERWA